MGTTGAGKSSVGSIANFDEHCSFQDQFVNAAAGVEVTPVGHFMQSCTQEIKVVACKDLDGRRVVLVDTPGFNDTQLPDATVFRMVAQWLKET